MPSRSSRPRRAPRRGLALAALLAAVAAVAVVVFLVAGGGGSRPDPRAQAQAAVARFATDWSAGRDAAAAAATNQPAVARRALVANRRGLDGARVAVRAGAAMLLEDGRARAPLAVTWRIPAIGTWRSTATATLRRDEQGDWRVVYSPTLIDRHLRAGTRLGTAATAPTRASILDRAGQAIVRERAVVAVGLERDQVHDVAASARALAKMVDIDPDAYIEQVRGAGPKQFVEAVTLRSGDFAKVAARVRAVPGAQTVDGRAPLAPTRAFARAFLGTVGAATAEQVARSGGTIAAGDDIGQSGLQQQFDGQLRGSASRSVVTRDAATGDVVATLHRVPGRAPRAVRTTLSQRAQAAAESALGGVTGNAAVVVVQPSSGDVLAVANRPTDMTFDRGLGGIYPPGSTFKVVTTAALLRRGLDPGATVPCPRTITVDGRSFKNFEGEAGGSPSFADDFAISCNTAFIGLAGRLHDGDLTSVARDFGLGRDSTSAVAIARSRVPAPAGAVAHAAAMIGQDRVTATPLAMAGVAATVSAGRWHAPRLLSDDRSTTGPRLPSDELAPLRSLMRGVITHGTGASALSSTPGEPIGKSGTAEYGTGNPPPTHAWFIAARGDLAIAVLIEHGSSGGAVAAPVVARFLRAYGT
ncbi:penicillin-binding transpeptidase domain-containing protein [Conexibacter woesei]|uniref:penicillin-binding transpeptidase domain-containing protein n=1 Tax=Conexibacter woesei TaxID=191495 RepID=UPI0003FD5237|nr:penicillin-binding transpeptidase domain-containing protein [Conexibacter woesei]